MTEASVIDWKSHYRDVRSRLRVNNQRNIVMRKVEEPPAPDPEPVPEEIHVEPEPAPLPPLLARQFTEAHMLLKAARISAMPRWKEILRDVCAKHRMHPEAVTGPSREAPLVLCRREVYYRLRTELGMSLSQIGLKLNKDHTSVLYGVREFEKALGKK